MPVCLHKLKMNLKPVILSVTNAMVLGLRLQSVVNANHVLVYLTVQVSQLVRNVTKSLGNKMVHLVELA